MGTYEEEYLKGQMYGLLKFMGDFISAVMVVVPGGREKAIGMCEEMSRSLPDGFLPHGSNQSFAQGVKEAYRIMGEAIRSGRGFNA